MTIEPGDVVKFLHTNGDTETVRVIFVLEDVAPPDEVDLHVGQNAFTGETYDGRHLWGYNSQILTINGEDVPCE